MHGRMIGVTRGAQAATLALLLLIPAFTPLARATPAWLAGARRTEALAATAAVAADALAAMAADLEVAIDHARQGTALVVDGEEPPAPELRTASEAVLAAVASASNAGQAVDALRGMLAAVRPDERPLPSPADPTALTAIAGQLVAAAEAAGPFVERRRAAARTVERLGAALAALDDDDPVGALARLDEARAAHGVVAAWEQPPRVLPVWLETSAALIDAVEALAKASLAGDEAAVEAAGAAYRSAAERARQADAALAISVAEAGSAVAALPLGRLAEAAAQVNELRLQVASFLLAQS
jgi:hypothetical protein